MKSPVFAIVAILMLGGCTTTTRLTDDQIKLRSNLSEPEASRRLLSYLQPMGAGGFCRTASPFTNTAIAHLRFEHRILSFDAKRSVAAASVSGGYLSTGVSLVDERDSVDLSKLKRIQRIEPKDRGQSGCGPLDWSVVIAHPADGPAFWVVVQPDHAGELVALLSFFSPNAELTAGVGF
jgi:hypothetical protein